MMHIQRFIAILVPGVVALVGMLVLIHWFGKERPVLGVAVRRPGADRPAVQEQPVNLAGVFTRLDGVPAELPGRWPQFRGEHGDGVSSEDTPLARSWGADGPAKLWSVEMGEGYAGAAVRDGRVYVLDYDQQQRNDMLRCLSLADGRDIWRRAYPVKVKRNHGMSRTVPAVSDKYVVTLGPKCHVLCVDADTGAYRWGIDLVRQYHTKVPPWYAGQCPLIVDDTAIIAPGGDALVIAVDCASGKVIWQTPNPLGWKMSHASIMSMTVDGRKTYVYCASGGVAGIDARDGTLLWSTDKWKINIATVPTPVILPGNRIFLTGGYNAGSMMLQLSVRDGRFEPVVLFRLPPAVFGSDQMTPIFYQDYLYGVIPGGELVCLDLAGKTVWRSGSTHRFGIGPYMIAGGMLYVMNDTGVLTLVEATPQGYRQLAQAKVLDGHDSWGPFALVGNRLIARDLTRMVCLDVGQR